MHAKKRKRVPRHRKPQPFRTVRDIGAVLAAMTLAFIGATLPANAHDGYHADEPWRVWDTNIDGGGQSPSDHSEIIDSFTADLTWFEGDDASSGGTSLETADLGVPVKAGDIVTVNYDLLDGADPAAGSTRLFIYLHSGADTFGEGPDEFVAAPDNDTMSGVLELEVPEDGTIGTAGLVYDTSNGGVPGTVRFTDLAVEDAKVSFDPPHEATPTAPSFAHPVCDDPGTLLIPDIEGVMYLVDGDEVDPGARSVEHGERVTVAVEPTEGYVFSEGTDRTQWDFTAVARGCPGEDGTDGEDGEDGEDGTDGEDGETVVVTDLPTRIDTGR